LFIDINRVVAPLVFISLHKASIATFKYQNCPGVHYFPCGGMCHERAVYLLGRVVCVIIATTLIFTQHTSYCSLDYETLFNTSQVPEWALQSLDCIYWI